MTPAGFMALRHRQQDAEDREQALYAEIVETCEAQLDLPRRELHRRAHEEAETHLHERLHRAFAEMAETIRTRLEINEQLDADPGARATTQKGTRH